MSHEAGKGDARRPTNHKSFSDNFDKIFGGGKHYKEGSLEKQVLDDQIAQATKELEQSLLGINNERK